MKPTTPITTQLTQAGLLATLLDRAATAPTLDDAVRLAAVAVTTQLLSALKVAGVPKAEHSIDALKRSRLDRLLVRALARGRVTHTMVTAELDRMRKALAARTASAQDLKLGIVAFDEASQRLALVAGKTGPFQYPL